MKTHLTTHSLSSIKVIVIFLLLSLPVMAQVTEPDIRQLTVGTPIERTVRAEEALHVYAVELKRGQVLRVNLQEAGVDVTAFTIRASDQQKASAISNFGGGFMQRGVGFGTSLAYNGFSSLPYVPTEISKILGNPVTGEEGFFAGQVFLDRAFTREAMLANLRTKPELVHIASHFIFQPGDSRKSFLLLGDGSRLSLVEMQQIPSLFGDVDLLTLSACETGGQQPNADGKEVDGFAEVAQRLGASSVIATLWRIADDGTSNFMTEFYRLRKANPAAPKSEILRQAQLSLLNGKNPAASDGKASRSDILGVKDTPTGIPFKPRDGSPLEHPYYWASFVLFGSPR
jgi:CHAT domain-containing protein